MEITPQAARLPASRIRLGWKNSLFVMLAALIGETEDPACDWPTSGNLDWIHSLVAQIEEGLKSFRQEVHSVDRAEVDWLQCIIVELRERLSSSRALESSASFLAPAVRIQLLNLLARHNFRPEKKQLSMPTAGRSSLCPSRSIHSPISSPNFTRSPRAIRLTSKVTNDNSIERLEQGSFIDLARLEKCIFAHVDVEDAAICQAIFHRCAVTSENSSIFEVLTRACQCTAVDVSFCVLFIIFLLLFLLPLMNVIISWCVLLGSIETGRLRTTIRKSLHLVHSCTCDEYVFKSEPL